VRAAHALTGGRIACASGADRFKVEMQLAQVGLLPYFDGRVFSGHEMPRSKPAPDVYLAAAAHIGVGGAECLVIEDTPTGVAAGVAAGVAVSAAVAVDSWQDAPLMVQFVLTAPGGSTQQATAGVSGEAAALAMAVADPQLWWPNGYGEQPL